MNDATTVSGEIISGSVIDRLLATADCSDGERALANSSLAEEAAYKYALAYGLSGGRDLHHEAHSAGIDNLLGHTVPAAVAFALHHLDALLPDLTIEQWERLDAAAIALHSRICEDLTGANGTGDEPQVPADAVPDDVN
ncbi:hypothetical protein ACN6AT_38135 (plasmid) [Streptomyces sp. JL4002]|uniref:Uncharacterized protein n=1 Tax=Streptomyces liliifuscus TaxID=2797636 RepID=A0A7T7RI21_9ACTN|nr:hypothetical protein [Streptomyces liliifuscus]QQM47384.1 hypothetical protein JEQ17_48260 [Streptomyces liliifuscus]